MLIKQLILFAIWATLQLLARGEDDTCVPTSAEDVLLAAYHANYVGHKGVKVGHKVEGAKDYKVIKVIDTHFTWLRLQPLKVIVTKKSCRWSWQCHPTIVVSFMGTRTAAQLVNQISSRAFYQLDIMDQPVEVMEYFYKALQVLDIVNTVLVESSPTRYIITGHSLGGAMASIFSALMMQRKEGALWSNPKSRLITFGEPRVGDQLYAAWHDMLILPYQKLRIVNNGDIVPRVPPKMAGYRHESREIWLEQTSEKEWYWGWCSVVVPWCYTYRYLTVWHVCSNGEAVECSKKTYDHSFPDHLMGNYLNKVKILNQYPEKKAKFVKAQCP